MAAIQNQGGQVGGDSISLLTQEVVAWADSAFPLRTPQSAFLKMFSEIGEVVESPTPDEFADVFIMLLDLANMHQVDVAQAVRDKLQVNRSRTWAAGPMGAYRHQEGPAEVSSGSSERIGDGSGYLGSFYNLGWSHAAQGREVMGIDRFHHYLITEVEIDEKVGVSSIQEWHGHYKAGYSAYAGVGS